MSRYSQLILSHQRSKDLTKYCNKSLILWICIHVEREEHSAAENECKKLENELQQSMTRKIEISRKARVVFKITGIHTPPSSKDTMHKIKLLSTSCSIYLLYLNHRLYKTYTVKHLYCSSQSRN